MVREQATALVRSPAAQLSLFVVAYSAASFLSRYVSAPGGPASLVCAYQAGVLLGTLLIASARRQWMFAVAAIGLEVVNGCFLWGQSPLFGISAGVATCLEVGLALFLMRQTTKGEVRFEEVRDVWFLLLSAVGATIPAASLHASMLSLIGMSAPFFTVWRTWWIAHSVALLTLPPAVVFLANLAVHGIPRPTISRAAETVVLFGLVIFFSVGVYGEMLPPPFTVPVYLLPLLFWATWRFPAGICAILVVIIGMAGLANTARGLGPYAKLEPRPMQRTMRAQAVYSVAGVSVLFLSLLVTEKKRAEREKTRIIGELQHALAEIKMLRGLIPVCAWCKSIRNDGGFWQRLEEYLAQHTNAEFTHAICPECLAKQMKATETACSPEKALSGANG